VPAWRWASQPHRTGQHTPSRPPVIEEDSPQWDCRYDGNRICGVGATLPDGSLAIPGDYGNDNCWPGAIYCPPAAPRSTFDGGCGDLMTVQRIDPRRDLPAQVRQLNRGVMDMFIGADPYGRRHLSPRTSVVLYTADGRFGYALNERPSSRMLGRL